MDEAYEFKNEKYKTAIKEIKAVLFDVVAMEEGQLAMLERTAKNKGEEERKEIEELISKKSDTLNQILEATEQLNRNITKLDSNYTAVSKLNNQEVGTLLADIGDKKVTSTIQKEVNTIKKENDDILEQIETGVKEMPESIEQPLRISDIKEGVTTTTEKLEQEVTELPPQTSVSQEELISEVPELEAVNNQLEMLSDQEETVKNNAGSNPLKQKREVNKFRKITKTATKAILVRKEQLEKLAQSKLEQKKVVELLGVFEGVAQFQQTQEALEQKAQALDNRINATVQGMAEDKSIDKERQIEDLMVKANVYYNAGETEKAKALYDQIGVLNQAIKKATGGEVLIKK